MAHVAIIGLGYVGLTLATALARSGHHIHGIEKSGRIVSTLNRGETQFHEPGLEEIFRQCLHNGLQVSLPDEVTTAKNFDFIIITVGTPLTDKKHVNLKHISSAVQQSAALMSRDCILILRSTIPIGLTTKIQQDLTSKLGYECAVAFCPERTCEGNALQELGNIPQIIGTSDHAVQRRAADLFSSLGVEIVACDSPEEAEATKLFCNTYRDFALGMGNLFYHLAKEHGLNSLSIIKKANYQYPRCNILQPGLVGGPCLTKDPTILASTVTNKELSDMVCMARRQSELLSRRIKDFLLGKIAASSGRILISGLAFKGMPETSDLRDSLNVDIAREMLEQFGGSRIDVHDFAAFPDEIKELLAKESVSLDSMDTVDKRYEGLVILNNHWQYQSPAFYTFINDRVADDGWILDCWNRLDMHPVKISNIAYFDLGNME